MFENKFVHKKLLNVNPQDLFYLIDKGLHIKEHGELYETTNVMGVTAIVKELYVPIDEIQKYDYYISELIWYSNKHYRYNQRTCKWNTKEIPMKYKDLKEFDVENWDGKPFKAIVSDKADDDIGFHEESRLTGSVEPNLVIGFINGKWSLSPSGSTWNHAYRIEDNKDVYKTHRMTNNQLLQWLSKGKGLLKHKSGVVCTTFSYHESDGENECDEGFTIREWHQTEWVYPSVELLKPVVIDNVAGDL